MASVTIRGRFEEGKKVELYPGGDFFNSSVTRGKALASATVKDGAATFDKLPAGVRYFAVQEVDGEFRHATVTAKDAPPAKRRQSEEDIAEVLRGTLPAHNEGSGVITGPRSTGNATLDNPTAEQRAEAVREQSAIPAAHDPSGKGQEPDSEHLKQADAPKGADQRSSTPMGEAQVIAEGEVSPPVVTESALGREERERLEAESKPKRKRRPAQKAAAKKPAARKRPPATEAQKAARRKKSAARAKARKAKGG